jgi:hypothetical protein
MRPTVPRPARFASPEDCAFEADPLDIGQGAEERLDLAREVVGEPQLSMSARVSPIFLSMCSSMAISCGMSRRMRSSSAVAAAIQHVALRYGGGSNIAR